MKRGDLLIEETQSIVTVRKYYTVGLHHSGPVYLFLSQNYETATQVLQQVLSRYVGRSVRSVYARRQQASTGRLRN